MWQHIEQIYREWLAGYGINTGLIEFIRSVSVVLVIIILAWLSNFITKRIIITFIKQWVKRSENQYDDVFLEKGVFNRLSQLAPALIVLFTIHHAFTDMGTLVKIIETLSKAYMVVVAMLVADSFMNALHEIYLMFPVSKNRPIKGYIQISKILIYFIGIIFIIAILSSKSPFTLMAGLGAMAAVLMLVFKDTILGFVASIQLSANDMLKPGDWITMASKNADGTVTEINLNTVKIQNFDHTICTVPTYTMVTEPFINWKGMQESNGRRITRSIFVDMISVKFCDQKLLDELAGNEIFKAGLKNGDFMAGINGKPLITNLKLFRQYMQQYLECHSSINHDLTTMVREKQPGEFGLPVEFYFFSTAKETRPFEELQCEVIDHALAMLPVFGLRAYQRHG